MAGMRCTFDLCKNSRLGAKKSGKNISFHRFPKDKHIRQIWISKCSKASKWGPNSCFVCSEHFTEDDFKRDLQAELLGLPPKKRLKETAIPLHQSQIKSQDKISEQSRRMQEQERKEIVDMLLKEIKEEDSVATAYTETKICCIRRCKNVSNGTVMEFFPLSSVSVDSKWITACCKKNQIQEISKAWICSAHFEDEAFIIEMTDSDFVRTLANNAVPTLHLPNYNIVMENGDEVEPLQQMKFECEDGVTETENSSEELPELLRIKKENEELERSIKEDEIAIKAVEKAILDKRAELNIANNEVESNERYIQQQNDLLSKVFSKSQIRVLSGKKWAHWTDDDMAVAYTIRQLSNVRTYNYLKQKLNIPLPGLSSIKKWVNRKGNTKGSTPNER